MSNFNFNKVILGGRLTAGPELKQTPQGVSVLTFSIAVARKGKDAATDFINCVAWRQNAEFISKYFKKGNSICISGNVQVRTYEDVNKNKRTATEIIVEEAFFVDSKTEDKTPKFIELNVDDELPFN